MNRLKHFFVSSLMIIVGSCFAQCAESDLGSGVLSAIRAEIYSIFQDQLFFEQISFADQPELSKLKIIVDAEISRIDGGDVQKIGCLRDLIFNFKSACLTLELLSVKHNVREYCFLNPLDFVELELVKVKVFKDFFANFYLYPKLGADPQYVFKKSILAALPIRFKKSFLDYLALGFTQKSRDVCWINKVLNNSFYESYSVLAEEYLEVVAYFYKVKNYQEQIDSAEFINKIEQVIEDFVNEIRQDSYTDILNIYLSKLIKIRNYFINFYTPEASPEKSKLLIRFKLLLDNEKIERLCADMSFCGFFNLYCNILHKFFGNDTALAGDDLQLFELGLKLEKIKNDKQASFLKSCICKPSEAYVVIEEMQSLLRDINCFINKKLNRNESNFLSNFFSGQWLDTGEIGGGAESVLRFIEQVFGRKIDSFKEAAFYLLASTSPALASVLIRKILPYLSSDLQEKVSTLIGEIGQAPENLTNGRNKILDFIANNPEIFKKLCEVKPGIVDTLADVVEQNLVALKM